MQDVFKHSVGQCCEIVCVGSAGVLMYSVLPCECEWTHDSQQSIHYCQGTFSPTRGCWCAAVVYNDIHGKQSFEV